MYLCKSLLIRKSKINSIKQVNVPIKEYKEIRLRTFSAFGKSVFVKISTKLIPKAIDTKIVNVVIFQNVW